MALDAADFRPCAGCSVLLDPVGDHALCCSKVGLYARHNDLRDEFAALCVEAGLALELEKGPDNLRPADVLVHGIDNSTGYRFFSFFSPLTFKYVIVQWQEKHVWHGNGVELLKVHDQTPLVFLRLWDDIFKRRHTIYSVCRRRSRTRNQINSMVCFASIGHLIRS